MFKEYALDPSVFSDLQNSRLFFEQFNFETGRLIAKAPCNWLKKAYKSLPSSTGDVAKKRFVVCLEGIKKGLIDRNCDNWKPDDCWLDNILREDARSKFHAIIQNNTKTFNHLLNVDDLPNSSSLWTIGLSKFVLREAEQMAKAIGKLLLYSSEFYFVDPNFTPEPRFLRPFAKFLEIMFRSNRNISTIQYHLKKTATLDCFMKEAEEKIKPIIPSGLSVEFYRWNDIGLEALHDRYVITDRGGVSFSYGLDQARRVPTKQTVKITREDSTTCDEILNLFDVKSGNFILEDSGPIVISS